MYYYTNIFHYKAYTQIEIKHQIKININTHSNFTSHAPALGIIALVVDTTHKYTSELLDSSKIFF